MSLEAAAGRLRVVEHHGRRYIVRAPTLATVLLASGLFPDEIAAFAHLVIDNPGLLDESDPVRRGILEGIIRDTSDGRAGEVLETCCRHCGGQPGDVLVQVIDDAQLAIALGLAVLSLCDVPRCFDAAGWREIGKTPIDQLEQKRPVGWFDPSDQKFELGVVAFFMKHGTPPTEYFAWPFEVVLMVNEGIATLSDPEACERAAAASQDFPVGLGVFESLGIGYEKRD